MTAGAERYTVKGVTEQGVTVSCATNDTYCALYNMACGQVYTINVTASNHVCQDVSTSTQSVAIMTGEKGETHVYDESGFFYQLCHCLIDSFNCCLICCVCLM